MKRLSCVVGFAFALGAVAPLLADDLPGKIDVVIVSASSSSLENGGSSSSSAQKPASSASVKSSSSGKQSSSSRSLDDSPLVPVISHDTLRNSLPDNGDASMALPHSVSAPVAQGEDRWFDLQGRLLKGKPTVKGTYYHNGNAVVIK
ncbi:MAG: hypothetical protein IJ896_10590 [Fibrobacter sp.]|nr:hypothetical protein [Fibrobacter sp.]